MEKIKRQYLPYWEWEDWINGMWGKSESEGEHLREAIIFTGNHIKYGSAMREVICAWPRTMMNSLTNTSINRRAFLGHCAVCYKIKIPEYITRMAWKELTDEQRFLADKEAQEAINEWENDYRNRRIYLQMAIPVLP